MIHDLTLGYLDLEAIRGCVALVIKPMPEGIVHHVMGEFPDVNAEFKNGCVILPWHGQAQTAGSEAFALRLHALTGCQIADRRNGRLVDLVELERKKNVAIAG